jgi:hypothetical protein
MLIGSSSIPTAVSLAYGVIIFRRYRGRVQKLTGIYTYKYADINAE